MLQGHNRDTFNFAIKATYAEVNGEKRNLQKKPKTDAAKNSAKGRLALLKDDAGEYFTKQEISETEENQTTLLKTVYEDGKLLIDYSLAEIRQKL